MSETNVARPLVDLLVLDLSRVLAGPFATMLLADLGDKVIKVEMPRHVTTPANGNRHLVSGQRPANYGSTHAIPFPPETIDLIGI